MNELNNVILFGIIALLAILPACCSHQQPQIEMPVGATFKYHQYHNVH